ncbi:integrative conjugative element protein, RAQPRD family [Pseudomonas shahriarae]
MPVSVIHYLLFLSLTILHGSCYATSDQEQVQLSLIQRQLDTIEASVQKAEASSFIEPNERYRFDYSRLTEDIQRIRQGVQNYVSPSRAQPRDPSELTDDYLLETPPTEPSP